MPAAARVGDPTGHPGSIGGPGILTVLIGKQPAAVALDPRSMHVCAMPPTAGPHPPSPFAKGSLTVLIGGKPALRQGDLSGCGAPVTMGLQTVQIGG